MLAMVAPVLFCAFSQSMASQLVSGELKVHTDIDRAIREKAGNTELPAYIASPVNRLLNNRIWEKTGAVPMNKKAEGNRVCI